MNTIRIGGVWLVRVGDYAVVRVMKYGKWFEICREYVGATETTFSHIVEPAGIEAREHDPNYKYDAGRVVPHHGSGGG